MTKKTLHCTQCLNDYKSQIKNIAENQQIILFNLSAKTAVSDGGYSAWPRLHCKATFYLNGVAIAMPFKC